MPRFYIGNKKNYTDINISLANTQSLVEISLEAVEKINILLKTLQALTLCTSYRAHLKKLFKCSFPFKLTLMGMRSGR